MSNFKLKQSFTLVELTIVLFILSLLLGTVVVGKKIVDRAKVQRVIFEIDYYKKSFALFRDTFDVLPGNMDESACMKYIEFYNINNNINDIEDGEIGKYCKTNRASNTNSRMTDNYFNSPIIATSERWSVFLETMRQMRTGGVINEVRTTIADDETENSIDASLLERGPNDAVCSECISFTNISKNQGVASFDDTGAITIAGVSIETGKSNSYKLNFIRGSNDNNDSGEHELFDSNYRRIVDNNNVLFMYRNTPSILDSSQGNGKQATGIVSADIANKIDIKLDDGRPGSGLVLALKNGYVKSDGLTDVEKKKICYSQLQNNVSSAYYTGEDNVTYGCNLAIILK